MIDLSSYTAPFTRVKVLFVSNRAVRAYAYNDRWNGRSLADDIAVIQSYFKDSDSRTWRIIQDACGVKFYIYIDSDGVKVYDACPKQPTVDLLLV